MDRPSDSNNVFRNHNTILAAQLSGMCSRLSIAAQTNAAVGQVTTEFVKRVLEDCRKSWEGRFIENVPDIEGEEKVGDLLVLAHALWATTNTFLQPDEFEELNTRAPFGLNVPARKR